MYYVYIDFGLGLGPKSVYNDGQTYIYNNNELNNHILKYRNVFHILKYMYIVFNNKLILPQRTL